MTPEQIEVVRELLAGIPENGRSAFARAAAELLRLHDALERLYRMTPADVEDEANFLGVRMATLADTVEQIVRRYVQ